VLKPVTEHAWDLPPKEAVTLQRALASRVRFAPPPERIETVGGIDVSMRRGNARAAVVVMALPELQEIERVWTDAPIRYPYVPGLLSFREAPPILQALERMEHIPDVLMLDAQGYAHPRRLGLASHIGVLLDHPTVGCAKSRLCGTHEEPARERGAHTPLRDGDEEIGAVVRTRTGVRPVYVSVGHRMTLEAAVALVLACGKGYRLPEPTRQAHRAAAQTST
jgi:deoxyribonuclease V